MAKAATEEAGGDGEEGEDAKMDQDEDVEVSGKLTLSQGMDKTKSEPDFVLDVIASLQALRNEL